MIPTIKRIPGPGRWYAVYIGALQVTRGYSKASAAELADAMEGVRGLA